MKNPPPPPSSSTTTKDSLYATYDNRFSEDTSSDCDAAYDTEELSRPLLYDPSPSSNTNDIEWRPAHTFSPAAVSRWQNKIERRDEHFANSAAARSLQRRKRRRQSPHNTSIHLFRKKLVTIRTTLLATSLALILGVFWLLDSLKDPNFAILVDGNLNKHQPLAKMASVAGTLFLVILMEAATRYRERRRKDQLRLEKEARKSNQDVLDGGGVWTKMSVGGTNDDSNGNTSSSPGNDTGRIPNTIFRMVGTAYICALLLVAYLLSFHPGFRVSGGTAVAPSVWWHVLGYFQYVLIESYGSISVATFWSFVNSTLSLSAAKTYYGFIIAVAQIGAIGGSTVATIPNASKPMLIVVACGGIVLQILIMLVYGRNFPYAMVGGDYDDCDGAGAGTEEEYEQKVAAARRKRRRIAAAEKLARQTRAPCTTVSFETSTTTKKEGWIPLTLLSGLRLVFKHNYLLLVLGVSCLYEISLTCLDYQMKLLGLDRFSSPEFGNEVYDGATGDTTTIADDTGSSFAVFMGRYGQLTNFLSLLFSYFAFPYLMENHGLSYTLQIFPSLLLILTLTYFVALPMNLPVLFISLSILKALSYSVNDPAKEILYVPTADVVKFKAKFWIDVVGARIAKAVGSAVNTYAGTAANAVKYGSVPSVVSAGALLVVCLAAGTRFDSLLEEGNIVGIEEEEEEEEEWDNGYANGEGGGFEMNLSGSFDNGEIGITPSSDTDLSYSDTDWQSCVSIELTSRQSL